MHDPTPHARRVAALRYQADRLLQDAAAWGCEVRILSSRAPGRPVQVLVLRAVEPDPPTPPAPE